MYMHVLLSSMHSMPRLNAADRPLEEGHELDGPSCNVPRRHAAGRHDLATAVKQHGGFRAVAALLDRRLLYRWIPTDTDMGRLAAAVRSCQNVVGLRAHEMPSRTQLEQADMAHVVRWVTVAGGFAKVRTCFCVRFKYLLSLKPKFSLHC